MSRKIDKNKNENHDKNELQIRSSAAEYLTFIAANGDDQEAIEIRYEDENIWLTQKMMAALYDVSVSAINQHLKKIFDDNELDENSVIKKYLITANDGKSYNTKHYNLQAIIAVGFKVNNERAVQFRKWANQIVKDFTIKGWAMDDERLKNSGTKLTKDYFEKLLVKIREIRLSERRFYQKITDIYATSLDYDPSAKATKRFFAAIQNKLHYAIHGKTAAELNQMQRIVSSYLDMAELQAERHIPMTMEDWEKRLNGFLQLWDKEILNDAGKVSAALAKKHAESEFEKYRIIQDRLYKSDFDKFLELEDNTKDLEK
ncbi:RhuM family protein [Finegoldia magna]|uniref:RhuM family protein n=1 Tax=Finegoldia magna TaxID=1260 RepID=UPI0026F0AA3A|nr:RhuM family protein [Finegoldia magna]